MFQTSRNNPFWARMFKANHIFARRERNFQGPVRPGASKLQIKQWYQESIVELDQWNGNVAGTLQVELEDPIRKILSLTTVRNEVRIAIVRWLVGNIAKHSICVKCGREVSREHATMCSGADDFLVPKYIHAWDIESPATMLDQVLNYYRNSDDLRVYEDVYEAIRMIYQECLGYQQRENGYWVDEREIANDQNLHQVQVERLLSQARANIQRARQTTLAEGNLGNFHANQPP